MHLKAYKVILSNQKPNITFPQNRKCWNKHSGAQWSVSDKNIVVALPAPTSDKVFHFFISLLYCPYCTITQIFKQLIFTFIFFKRAVFIYVRMLKFIWKLYLHLTKHPLKFSQTKNYRYLWKCWNREKTFLADFLPCAVFSSMFQVLCKCSLWAKY